MDMTTDTDVGFQLLMVNFAGNTVTLDGCLTSDTIDAVAGAFATKLDLPKLIFRLVYQGTQLDAEYTLASYQITAGCRLHALPRLRGGVATPGSPPPSPPPSAGGSDGEGEDQREASETSAAQGATPPLLLLGADTT